VKVVKNGEVYERKLFTELFEVREEKETCKEWQEECVRAEISFDSGAYCIEKAVIRKESR
jgi:hypothetical protein